MLFGLFMGDWTVLVLIPAMILAVYAQIKVKSTFAKYDRVSNRRRMTGAEAARRILNANGLYDVQVVATPGQLTDHYDPRDRVVRLSDATYGSTSVAALGVAAHEVGHACQHAAGYAPLRLRNAIIPVTRIGSVLAFPLFLIGLLIANTTYYTGGSALADYLMMGGILAFSLSTLFQLLTLPTEFNASRRAMKTLEGQGLLMQDELTGARAVLSAAALTYVAALASSLASLLRLLLIFSGSRSRRR